MAEVTVRICDVCEEHDATTYTLGEGGDVRGVDLCPNHASPVKALLDALKGGVEGVTPKQPERARKAPSRAAKKASSPSRITVTSMDQVKEQLRDPFKAP